MVNPTSNSNSSVPPDRSGPQPNNSGKIGKMPAGHQFTPIKTPANPGFETGVCYLTSTTEQKDALKEHTFSKLSGETMPKIGTAFKTFIV